MKKTILLLMLTCFGLSTSSFGQECGTPNPSPNKKSDYVDPDFYKSRNQYYTVCVDVQFHVVRETNGNLAFGPENRDEIIANLNADFNSHNIYFNNVGTNFIDNSNFVDIDSASEAENLANQNNNPNALNYYIVENLWDVNDGSVVGTAIDIPSINLVIRNNRTLGPVSSHEVGHCLNLYHTHETSFGVEQINGNNCRSAGDLVCDTNADPKLSVTNVSFGSCNYTGGGGFNPPTENFMSYTRLSCMDNFTSGQGARMYGALANKRILQNIVSENCQIPNVLGATTTCYGSNYTYTITNGGNSVSWEVSSNLQILSSSNTGITVTPTSAFIREEGFVRAILPNETIEQYVWIGKPDAYTEDDNGVKNYMGGSFVFQQQSSGRGEFSVFTDAPEVNYTYDWTGPNNVGWWQINRNTIEVDLSFEGDHTFTANFTNECGTHYFFVFVSIRDGFSGIRTGSSIDGTIVSESITPNLQLYPNPAKNDISISVDNTKLVSVELYDIYGTRVKVLDKLNTFNHKLNVNSLRRGYYIVKARLEDGTIQYKNIILK